MNDTMIGNLRTRRLAVTRGDESRGPHRFGAILLRRRDLKSFANAPRRGPFIKGVADDLHRAISTFARWTRC